MIFGVAVFDAQLRGFLRAIIRASDRNVRNAPPISLESVKGFRFMNKWGSLSTRSPIYFFLLPRLHPSLACLRARSLRV